MAIYRHAGRNFSRERDALAELPRRVGDEITRCARDGEPFFRHYVAVMHGGEVSWLFVGAHVPALDAYQVGTAVAS